MNTPSDGSPRPTTNGMFFVNGTHNPVEYAVFPDNRIEVDVVDNIFITTSGMIRFDEVANATGYEIKVGEETYQTVDPFYQLELDPGLHEIQIKTLAYGVEFKDSIYTEAILYNVYSEDMNSIIEFFTEYTKRETNE